ncbi:MAG: mechanosensitive ion channel [Campylobacteraceae bacterium]|nr:mechanosensitive ion channel [Campylobacteraceae bacterium]
MEEYFDKSIDVTMQYAPSLILAIVVLIVGLWVIGLLSDLTVKIMKKSKTDETLIPFTRSLVSWLLKVLLFISVASMIGIATTSFIAVLGAAGLAIGLALQGSLSNFAGGVLLLIFKPYKIGDLIESQGQLGTVKEIQIFNTILTTFQNKTIILPNSVVSSNSITNVSANGTVRVDLEIGISYDSSIDDAKEVLLKMMNDHPKVLKDPAPSIGVCALADSSVNLQMMPWCNCEDYWTVFFEIQENAKKALDENKITIPFPQRDVHIFEQK